MIFRFLLLFVFVAGCVDRTFDDMSVYEPADERRTRAEIIQDVCALYIPCSPDLLRFTDEAHCLDYWEFHLTVVESDSVRGPRGCAPVLLDIYACASAADTCEDFRSSWHEGDGSNPRCAAEHARFTELRCRGSA